MAGLQPERSLLLTGATGFVGGAARPALAREGWRLRGLTRDAARAKKHDPTLDWVQGDVSDPASCARALDGCQAALYLVHGIGEGVDYHRHEVMAAATFSKAAAAVGPGSPTELPDLRRVPSRYDGGHRSTGPVGPSRRPVASPA